MKPVINSKELRGILERGLKAGLWSVFQFNAPGCEPVLPSAEFLEENPQFADMNFRDLEAFRRQNHNAKTNLY